MFRFRARFRAHLLAHFLAIWGLGACVISLAAACTSSGSGGGGPTGGVLGSSGGQTVSTGGTSGSFAGTGGGTGAGTGGIVGSGGAGMAGQSASGGRTTDGGAADMAPADAGGSDRPPDGASTFEAGVTSDGAADRSADSAADPLEVDVYLIGGQSNATGQGYIKNYPVGLVPNVNVGLYHSGAPHLNSGALANTWIPLRQASESPDRFGPEIGFGNEIQRLYPARKIYLIKHAHTGTNLYRDWVPGATAGDTATFGPQFQVFVATVDGGLKGLRDKGLHPVIRGMLWQQGEGDADAGGTIADQYGAHLNAFIKRVRQQWNSPAMLFIYGYVYPPPNVGAGRDAVRLGERNVDAASGTTLATPGAFVVETDDLSQRADDPGTPLPNDRVHFGSAGQLELGRRMATKLHDNLSIP